MKKKISLILLLLVVVLLLPNKVFGASEPFTGMEDYAWNVLIGLDEYRNGNCNILVTKFYDDYKVFFITKQTGLTFTFSDNNERTSKYGIVNENKRITFNMPVTFTQYNIDFSGVVSKTYSNQTENEYITFNPYDHGYSNTDIWKSDGSGFFFNPPPQEVVAQAVERVGVVGLKQATKETLAILPVILSVLVFLLAFSKGLNLLLSFLRKS